MAITDREDRRAQSRSERRATCCCCCRRRRRCCCCCCCCCCGSDAGSHDVGRPQQIVRSPPCSVLAAQVLTQAGQRSGGPCQGVHRARGGGVERWCGWVDIGRGCVTTSMYDDADELYGTLQDADSVAELFTWGKTGIADMRYNVSALRHHHHHYQRKRCRWQLPEGSPACHLSSLAKSRRFSTLAYNTRLAQGMLMTPLVCIPCFHAFHAVNQASSHPLRVLFERRGL